MTKPSAKIHTVIPLRPADVKKVKNPHLRDCRRSFVSKLMQERNVPMSAIAKVTGQSTQSVRLKLKGDVCFAAEEVEEILSYLGDIRPVDEGDLKTFRDNIETIKNAYRIKAMSDDVCSLRQFVTLMLKSENKDIKWLCSEAEIELKQMSHFLSRLRVQCPLTCEQIVRIGNALKLNEAETGVFEDFIANDFRGVFAGRGNQGSQAISR